MVLRSQPTTKLQMIAADDIGKFGAKAFVDADQMKNVDFDIAGDSVTWRRGRGRHRSRSWARSSATSRSRSPPFASRARTPRL